MKQQITFFSPLNNEKKTQHLIVSFELGPFKSNKVEIFTKGAVLFKNMFSSRLKLTTEY